MKKKLLVISVVLILFFGLSWSINVKAVDEPEIKTLLEKAKLITQGEYKGEVKGKESNLYKIEVSPGKQIKLYAKATVVNCCPDLWFTLFDQTGRKLSSQDIFFIADMKEGEVEVFYLSGTTKDFSAEETKLVLFEVRNAEEKSSASYSFNFVLDTKKTDIGLTTDAGDDFDIACDIKPGDYPKNFLAKNKCGEKYCSTDHEDMYKISVKVKEKLTIKITPDANLQPKINFFNELEEAQAGGETAANKGAIVETSYISPKDQDVYFVISDAAWEDWYYGSYAMNVTVKTATAEELEEAGIVEEEVVPEEEVTVPKEAPLVVPEERIPEAVAEFPEAETFVSRIKGALIWLVIGIIVFIGIIVTVVVLILKARKRPPKPPVSPAPPTPPKAPPTEEAPPATPEAPKPPEVSKPPEEVPKPPSEEGTSGMILPPKELRGK